MAVRYRFRPTGWTPSGSPPAEPSEFVTFDIPGHEAILGPLTYMGDGEAQSAEQPWPWYDSNQLEAYTKYGSAMPEALPITEYTGKVSVTQNDNKILGTGTQFTQELKHGMFLWPLIPYSGTISITNGDDAVTGAGTLFTSEFNHFLDHEFHFEIGGVLHHRRMATSGITDTTHRMVNEWDGPSVSGITAYRARGSVAHRCYIIGFNAFVVSDTEITLTDPWPHESMAGTWLLGDVTRAQLRPTSYMQNWWTFAYDGVRCLYQTYHRTGDTQFLLAARRAAQVQIGLDHTWKFGQVLEQTHDGIHLYALDLDNQGIEHQLWDIAWKRLMGGTNNNYLTYNWLGRYDWPNISSARDQGYILRWTMNLAITLPDTFNAEGGGVITDGAAKRADLLFWAERFITQGLLRWQQPNGLWVWQSIQERMGNVSNMFHMGIMFEGVIMYHRLIKDDPTKADIYDDIRQAIYKYVDCMFTFAHRQEGTPHAQWDNAIASDPYVRATWVYAFRELASDRNVDQFGTITLTPASTTVTGVDTQFEREFGYSNGGTPIYPWFTLTGTVSFNAATPTILTGSGTAFLTELVPGQVLFLDYPHSTQLHNRKQFKVATVDSDTQVTLSEASVHASIAGATASFLVVNNLAGLVSVSGNVVTGVGTSFLTDFAVGDFIAIQLRATGNSEWAFLARSITAINSDTELVIDVTNLPATTAAFYGKGFFGAYYVASVASNGELTLTTPYNGPAITDGIWCKPVGGAMVRGGDSKIDASRQNNDEYVYVYAYAYKLALGENDTARAARYRGYYEEVMGASFGETNGLNGDGETSLAWEGNGGGTWGYLYGVSRNQSARNTASGLAYYNGAD